MYSSNIGCNVLFSPIYAYIYFFTTYFQYSIKCVLRAKEVVHSCNFSTSQLFTALHSGYTAVTSAEKEDHKFEATLDYIVNSSPAQTHSEGIC